LHGNSPPGLAPSALPPEGEASREYEFYLAGNVELRMKSLKESRTLHADEVFYDVSRNVAIATKADFEFTQPKVIDPVHCKAEELFQLSPTQFKAVKAEIYSS